MVFTRAVGEQHASTAAGVKAIKDLGKDRRFIVNATADPTEFRADRLKQFRAVVFLNTSGDVLTDAAAGRLRGLLPRRRRLRRHPLGDRDRARLGVPDRRPRHALARARSRRRAGHRQGRRPRARRQQEPARVLAARRTSGTTSPPTSAAARTCSRPSTRRPTPAATMGFDHPIAWCKDFRGGRSFYTAGGHTAAAYGEPAFRAPPGRRHRVGGRRGRPGLQRLRRDRARQLRADEDQRAAEPQRADRLRPAARRAHPPDRPRRPAAPARPGDRQLRRSSRRCRSTPTARTACTGRRSTTTSPPTAGSTSSTRR